jgi:hypothetical protein
MDRSGRRKFKLAKPIHSFSRGIEFIKERNGKYPHVSYIIATFAGTESASRRADRISAASAD